MVYEAEVDEQIARLIETGEMAHVSIGADWIKSIAENGIPLGSGLLSTPEGVVPYNFSFSELSLVTNEWQPGDLDSTVKLWECLLREIAEEQRFKPPRRLRRFGRLQTQEQQVQEQQATWVWDERLKAYVEAA